MRLLIAYKKAYLVVIIDLNKFFYLIDLENCDYILLIKWNSSLDRYILLILLISKINIL